MFHAESPRERRVVIILLLTGLMLRLLLATVAIRGPYDPNERLRGDTAKYLAIGLSLSRGEGLALHYLPVLREALSGREIAPRRIVPTSDRSPGYPLFLAGAFSMLGYDLRMVVILQAVLSSFTPLLIYLTARELEAAPVAALAFGVFYYPFAFDAAVLMTEWLFTLCTALSFWLIVRRRSEGLAGVAAGLAVLVKSVTLPFLLLVALVPGRRRLRMLLGLACVVAPFAYRNYLHTGVPYVTASYGGAALFLLHNPENRAFPSFDPPGDVNEAYPGFRAARSEIRARGPVDADPVAQEYLFDREQGGAALRFIRAEPAQALKASWASFVNTWRLHYPGASPVRRLCDVALYACLVPLVLWGSLSALRCGPAGARLSVFFLLYFVLVHSVFVSQIRYRTPAMPVFFVLAASGLSSLWRFRTREEVSS